MQSMLFRTKVLAVLATLGLAGCSLGSHSSPSGDQAPTSKPLEHRVMRLPVQLAPEHPSPPPATATSPVPPSLPHERGSASSKQFALQLANGLSSLFHDAASRVLPAVVTIRTVSRSEETSDDDPDSPGLFGNEEEVHESMGSGLIIDPSGIVLTNYHVVREKGKTMVQLHDGRQFEIAATKADPHTDLAVLQLKNASGLPVARLGDSDALEVGDWVLAVGNPFGLEATVTAGIISAKGRGLDSSAREQFLQTDAPINPGNSGGPLVNLRGDVVGINTAISSTTGGYQGIGFAIPINLVKSVGRQLIEKGKVSWPYLGVGVRKVTADVADELGVGDSPGVIVLEVRRGSPAAHAGIEPGDVITRFDDKPISEPGDLRSALDSVAVGSLHSLALVRKGKPQTVQVTAAQEPAELETMRRTSGDDQ